MLSGKRSCELAREEQCFTRSLPDKHEWKKEEGKERRKNLIWKSTIN